jgi:hypothetical protein
MTTQPNVIPDYAYPAFVHTDEDKERWRLALDIASKISRDFEPSGNPDPQFVFYMSREVFFSDIPTGSPEDAAPPPVPIAEARVDSEQELLDELDRLNPPDDATAEEHYAHVGRVTDFLEALFGNPDEFDLGDHPTKVLPPGHGLTLLESEWGELEEAFFHGVPRLPYSEKLHPRDRMGKWTQGLHAVRSFVAEHRSAVRAHLAGTLAAARLRYDVARAHLPGGGLHAPLEKAHQRDVSPAERLRAHAAEQRARQGLRGAKREAYRQTRQAKGHALYAMAFVYSEHVTEKAHRHGIPAEAMLSDQTAAYDQLENAKTTKELAHEVAHYAFEHRDEIKAVLRAAGHIARHTARAKGIAAADVTEEDEELADVLLEGLIEG